MIPYKNTSARFSNIGRSVGGTTLTGSQIRAKASGYESEISSLQKGERNQNWIDALGRLESRIFAEPIEVRCSVSNIKTLSSLLSEAGRIKNTPTTSTPTTKTSSTQTTGGGPTAQTSTKTKEPFDISTLWVSVILFNIPTVIFLFLAFTFQGWFNVWLGFAILWFICATCFIIVGIVVDDESPAPPDIVKVCTKIGVALPIIGMLVFFYCLFFGGMLSTAILTFIGVVLGAFFMCCSAYENATGVRVPAAISSFSLVISFALGIFTLCLYFNAGWVTWIFGIIAILVLCIFGSMGIGYIDELKTYIAFLFIPSFILAIIAISGLNATFGIICLVVTVLTSILAVYLAKK